jgi:hypothetical protein
MTNPTHIKVKYGRCGICGHYGDDCTGVEPPEQNEGKLVCKDCGKVTDYFRGWAFCGGHCHGDQSVKMDAYHSWRES